MKNYSVKRFSNLNDRMYTAVLPEGPLLNFTVSILGTLLVSPCTTGRTGIMATSKQIFGPT